MGLRSVAVAVGKAKHVRRYCGKLAPRTQCLVRHDMVAYELYGLRRVTLQRMLSSDVLKAGIRAVSGGYIGGMPSGDVLMLPGTFIVGQDGLVKYAYYSQHPGDCPEFDEILKYDKHL